MKRKLLSKMCKAIGREIRYVEYKLRRQQQEKKKKKQSRQDWLNGVNSEPQVFLYNEAKFILSSRQRSTKQKKQPNSTLTMTTRRRANLKQIDRQINRKRISN